MDGVLVDSEPQHIVTDLETLADFGVSTTPEVVRGFTGLDNRVFFTSMKETFDITGSVEDMILHKNRLFIEELRKNIIAVEGLNEMKNEIDKLVDIRALASSSFRDVVDTVIEKLSLHGWFTVTVAGDEVAVAKPDPAVFLRTAELLCVSPQECVVVEDSANGILSATRAGMRVIGFVNPLSGDQDMSGAEQVIRSLTELPSVISSFLYR